MQTMKQGLCGVIFALSAGCGAADHDELLDPPGGSTNSTASGDSSSESAHPTLAATAETLASIELDDGNVVLFERLADGILVSEHGPRENARRLQPSANFSAVDTFRALAPEREVPTALLDAHAGLMREVLLVESEDDELPAGLAEPEAVDEEESDHEFGEINRPTLGGGFFSSENFLRQACNFSLSGQYDFKHSNWNNNHTHLARGHISYVAVGADIGDATAQFCARLDGRTRCNAASAVPQGTYSSLTYDAGQTRITSCLSCVLGYCIGCRTLVFDNVADVSLINTAVSSSERIHDCGQFR